MTWLNYIAESVIDFQSGHTVYTLYTRFMDTLFNCNVTATLVKAAKMVVKHTWPIH